MSFPRPPIGRPRPRSWAGLLIALAGLGCSGMPMSAAPPPNREACERYAEHLNGLFDCVGLVYDSDNLCEGTDLVAVDLVPTYACLTEHTRCNGATVVLEADRCTLPLVALEEPIAQNDPVVGAVPMTGTDPVEEGPR